MEVGEKVPKMTSRGAECEGLKLTVNALSNSF